MTSSHRVAEDGTLKPPTPSGTSPSETPSESPSASGFTGAPAGFQAMVSFVLAGDKKSAGEASMLFTEEETRWLLNKVQEINEILTARMVLALLSNGMSTIREIAKQLRLAVQTDVHTGSQEDEEQGEGK